MKDFSFPKNYFQLIAMGASTGGTEALLAVLEKLPGNLPPIVITQHMPPVFTNMYAERLNRICKMEVREAKDGDPRYPGLCLIAPGGLQMQVLKDSSGMRVECKEGENGLLSMHEAGAYTLGQDEKSSIVYGMPMEAYKLGAVDRQGNLSEIANYLLSAIQ